MKCVKVLLLSAFLFLLCFVGSGENAEAKTSTKPKSSITTTKILKSFSLCKEYISYDQISNCQEKDYFVNEQEKEFRLTTEGWRDLTFKRMGIDYRLTEYYQLTVTDDQTFGYFNDKSIQPVVELLETKNCPGGTESTRELLFVMNDDVMLIAVPVMGRSVIYLKSMLNKEPEKESCKTFSSHAGIAFAYKYYKDSGFLRKGSKKYEEDIANAYKNINASVSIYTAGTIEYDKDWKTPITLTNCSGHFTPSVTTFVNFLYYLNQHYGNLKLLSTEEEEQIWKDANLYQEKVQNEELTAESLQKLFKSKMRIQNTNKEKSDLCFTYPMPPKTK